MNKFLTEKITDYGNNRLAADVGVSPQAVSKWAKRGELPPRRVRAVAGLMGVPDKLLSPELFGGEPDASLKKTTVQSSSQRRLPQSPDHPS